MSVPAETKKSKSMLVKSKNSVRNCLSVLVERREHNRRIIRFSALCIRFNSELILKFDVFFLLCSMAKLNSVLFKC